MPDSDVSCRAGLPVSVLADVVHAFPAYGEASGVSYAYGPPGWRRGTRMSESDLEKPVTAAGDERWDAETEPEAPAAEETGELPFDTNEADAAEQHREVTLDEDDYR